MPTFNFKAIIVPLPLVLTLIAVLFATVTTFAEQFIAHAKAIVAPVHEVIITKIGTLPSIITDALFTITAEAITTVTNTIRSLTNRALESVADAAVRSTNKILALPTSETYLQLVVRAPRDLVLRAPRDLILYGSRALVLTVCSQALVLFGSSRDLIVSSCSRALVTKDSQCLVLGENQGRLIQTFNHVIALLRTTLMKFVQDFTTNTLSIEPGMPFELAFPTFAKAWTQFSGVGAIMKWLQAFIRRVGARVTALLVAAVAFIEFISGALTTTDCLVVDFSEKMVTTIDRKLKHLVSTMTEYPGTASETRFSVAVFPVTIRMYPLRNLTFFEASSFWNIQSFDTFSGLDLSVISMAVYRKMFSISTCPATRKDPLSHSCLTFFRTISFDSFRVWNLSEKMLANTIANATDNEKNLEDEKEDAFEGWAWGGSELCNLFAKLTMNDDDARKRATDRYNTNMQ
ncbi:unnamed protein product, partial [Cylindrotheca closterium]